MPRPEALKRVPRAGYSIGGMPVNRSHTRVIDENKAIGATQEVHWQEPETGYSVIIEHEKDIRTGETNEASTGSSLQQSPGVVKQTFTPDVTAANEDIPDGGSRVEGEQQEGSSSGSA